MSSLNLTGHSIFELESGNRNADGQTNGQKTANERTELHQFQKGPSYDSDLFPVKFEFDWTNCFRVKSPEKEILTDRQTDKQTDGITPISKGT